MSLQINSPNIENLYSLAQKTKPKRKIKAFKYEGSRVAIVYHCYYQTTNVCSPNKSTLVLDHLWPPYPGFCETNNGQAFPEAHHWLSHSYRKWVFHSQNFYNVGCLWCCTYTKFWSMCLVRGHKVGAVTKWLEEAELTRIYLSRVWPYRKKWVFIRCGGNHLIYQQNPLG